jgi:hypothetical protein
MLSVLVHHDYAYSQQYDCDSCNGADSKVFIQEGYSQDDGSKRLKCTKDGGKGRADSSYSLYTGKIRYHGRPQA